jgi:Carboxypeptidase regulatory-like domain
VLIRGTVVDPSGAPVEWASVWLAAGPRPTPDIAALTDAGGEFTLTASSPGTYRIGCRAEGYDPVEVEVHVGSEDVEMTIAVRAAGTPGED